MSNNIESPRIKSLSWGCIKVVNYTNLFKDVKLFPGGAREWDWNETGTRHVPGIQIDDIRELLDHGADVIVLSKGFHEQLHTCSETIDILKEENIPFYLLQTEEAVNKYNELSMKDMVGALIHTTC